MKIRRALKLKPTSEQRQKMARTAGCVRLVWNKSLGVLKEELDKKVGYKGYCSMAGELKSWKKEDETKFLKCVHSQALQQTLKYLDRAFKDGFKKDKGFPRFKKKATIDPFAILKVSSEKGIVSIFLKLDGASSKKVER